MKTELFKITGTLLCILFGLQLQAQNSFTSVQDGDWNDQSTWFAGGAAGGTEGVDYPSAFDSAFVKNNVTIDVANNGTEFRFNGYLEIDSGDTLLCTVGSSTVGFALGGNGQMHNFGAFFALDAAEIPDPGAHIAKEFTIRDNAYFIGYTNSFGFIGDDWVMEDNSVAYLQTNVCYGISDDFIGTGTGWLLFGEGDIRIGGDGVASNVELNSGATAAQISDNITIYRNPTQLDCSGTALTTGTATADFPPVATDDVFSTSENTSAHQDVLNQGTPDAAIILGDAITLTSVGDNAAINDGNTSQGGTVTIDNNGTAGDPTDDIVSYTPPNNFTGTDTYQYIITNGDGGTDTATVTVLIACSGGQFVESASFYNLDLGGAKDGGLTWYDFNRDDLVDVIINTDDGTNDTRLYFQQPDGTFLDVTSTNAAALLTNNTERTVIAADLNNDGYVEFVRNDNNTVEVWQNGGPSTTPAFTFTLLETFTTNNEGINVEGITFVDWDQDGFLDLLMDNDDEEIVLYENDQDGTFTEQTAGTGLPTGDSGVGDYATSIDWDNDGFMDFAARKSDGGTGDFWRFNPGTSQFVEVSTPNLATTGGEKGAITFCDVDQDGDFDFIWAHQSDDDATTIYLQGSDGTFSAGTTLVTDGGVEECDCADIDNDGDNDIFLGDDGGTSYLFLNNSSKGGPLSFTQSNLCIDPNADVEGAEFVDVDFDGDMDLYMNINGGANQLWMNAQNDNNYLIVEPRVKLNASGNWRPATGANVMLTNCDDTCMVKDVSGGRGHGSQKPGQLHFGLGGSTLTGSTSEYTVIVFFLDSNGTRDTVVKTVTPSMLSNNRLIVYQDDTDDAVCIPTDTDGDGTPDSSDPDDDNDGVLDDDECLGELVVTTETGFFGSASLAFTINGNASVRTDPQVLQAITVAGTVYNSFILPDSLDVNYTSGSFDDTDARFLDGGVSQSQLSAAGEVSFETTGLAAFQDADLNHYQMLDTPVDSTADYYDVYYDTPILSNGKVYVAFSERGGNNQFAFEAFAPNGTAYNQRVELALADYQDSGFPIAALGGGGSQNAEIAVLPITDLAPIGSTIGRIRSIPFTSGSDAGDGKVFIFGSLTTLEGSCDSDGDGVDNGKDLDSDNDGIPDIVESGGVDTDGDGRVDDMTDSDNDGIVDEFDTDNGGTPLPNLDSDGDGVYDKNDLDADNDGVPDVNEIGGTDENGDGRADDYVDTDGDGLGDVIDGDVGNDNTAENSANALILTGIDSDNDSRPNSFVNGDVDGDNLLAHIDIDSDDDGITDLVEAGQTDADTNGRVDNYIDNDNDGFHDLVDGDSTNALAAGSDFNGNNAANALLKTSSDTDLDGNPESYPSGDSDSDGLRDLVDIDSDNDGITDNAEAMTSAGYSAPTNTDTDGDGLDDAYDPDNSGTYVTPVNTDGNGNADYLDTDSDDDGEDDSLEGHDSDGDGTADAGSPSSTGFAGGATDADNDGLLDGFDNNTSSFDPTNGGLSPGSHPNADGGAAVPDWREVPCVGGSVSLSTANSTTVASSFCKQGDWTYYYDPADDTELLFAIEHKPTGGNTNDFTATVSLTVSSDPDTEAGVFSNEDIGNQQATFVMGRYWNVTINSGSLNGAVNVRFFYDPNDADTLEAVADRWNAANAGNTINVSGLRWFQMTSGTFDPGTTDLQASGVNSSSELSEDVLSTEDGVNFVQFNGITNLTGGGQAFTIGANSVILPVELLSFRAVAGTGLVNIYWETAVEINSEYFDVQRSFDGETGWASIGTVPAAGNSQRLRSYVLQDMNPEQGWNYYRLKAVDRDATFEYSATEKVLFEAKESGIRIYPNPNRGVFNVVPNSADARGEMWLYNTQGKLIGSWILATGEVAIEGLESGIYTLNVVYDNGSSEALRVVVQ